MNILEKIVAHKRKEVKERKERVPVKILEQSSYFNALSVSMKNEVLRPEKWGIIAEIKRKSPSKGVINPDVSVERISTGYIQAGASALSVLTDFKFFGGSNEDLQEARKFNACPILRKDFVVDEYQILEAKAIGADAILLIAAVLDDDEVIRLAKFARSLGLETLLEVHNEKELSRINEFVDLVGVNNRDLTSFEVDINTSVALSKLIPDDFVKVSESGIQHPEDILRLKKEGFKGFLMGERFMKTSCPEETCAVFIQALGQLEDYAGS